MQLYLVGSWVAACRL